jgi:hypothetical protein
MIPMKSRSRPDSWTSGLALFALQIIACFTATAAAQNPQLQEKVAEIKEASQKNKQALGQYTWQEQVTISLKGEEKKQEHFQVRLGPDGKPEKTSVDPASDAAAEKGRHRLKEHIVEKKTEEYKEYADRMKELTQQ